MTGGLIDLTGAEEQTVKIQLKIYIRRFLPLAAVKYLPTFVGNLELRIRFSTEFLPVCVLFCVCFSLPRSVSSSHTA